MTRFSIDYVNTRAKWCGCRVSEFWEQKDKRLRDGLGGSEKKAMEAEQEGGSPLQRSLDWGTEIKQNKKRSQKGLHWVDVMMPFW